MMILLCLCCGRHVTAVAPFALHRAGRRGYAFADAVDCAVRCLDACAFRPWSYSMLGTAWNLSQRLQEFFDAALPLVDRKLHFEMMFAGAVMQHKVCSTRGSRREAGEMCS